MANQPAGPEIASYDERTVDVDGVGVFVRTRGGAGVPTVFVHGNPTDCDDWLPFMDRLPGPVVSFDLPGFSRSARPVDFDYSMHGQAALVGSLLGSLGIGRHNLVVHDWGGLALIDAVGHPERVNRLVVINAVPMVAGYRWHWIARIWRRKRTGAAFQRTTAHPAGGRWLVSLVLRQARPRFRAMPSDLIDRATANLTDPQTARAILRLYRSADPDLLATAADLAALTSPALVVWGEKDPYLPPAMGEAYSAALPGAVHERLPDAGHWPWIDRPDVIDKVTAFLTD